MTLGAPRLAALIDGAPCAGPIPSKTEAGRWVIDHLRPMPTWPGGRWPHGPASRSPSPSPTAGRAPIW